MVKVRSDSHIHEHEMQFAGHPIIGTSWVLMNKIFEINLIKLHLTVPVGEIPVRQVGNLVWLQAAQPQFWILFKEDFTTFSNLGSTDFEDAFPIQK
jgi:trans-2,3-dihydro-3-hydroxyanthranilate isomerase